MAVVIPSATEQITYADLYARWERGNWSATAIDLTQDRIDWHERMSEHQRRGALWLYTLFFHGEDTVADTLSPYIDAAPLEEQKYFLATQQVDEARHAVFFSRFMHEVAGLGDGTTAGTLAATLPELTWGHRMVFERLERMADELRRDRSPRKLASAVTLYHMIVEASLAQPGQHCIEESLERLDLLPGFRAGMRNVALDEQRHIAFGVRLLADLYREDPEGIQEAIVATTREVLPFTTAVPVPPGWDTSYTESFGFTLEDLFEQGAAGFEARLRAVGLPLERIPRFPFPMDLTPRERGERGLKLLRAGMLGPKEGPASRDPEAMAILFDTVRRQADPSAVPHGTTVQWAFEDAAPWHLRLENGATSVAEGTAESPDVTISCSFDDFVDVLAAREDPRRLLLRRRLRVRGRPRIVLRLPKVFPA